MTARWTMRRSGEVRATISVKYHVPREMVDWLIDNSELRNETAAMRWIRSHIHDLVNEWRVLVVDRDGEAAMTHADDVDTVMTDGYEVYDGSYPV